VALKRKEQKVANGEQFASFQKKPDFVVALARGLKVIEAFEGHPEGLTPADVAAQAGLSTTAVRRSLATLELLGYAQSDSGTYHLTTGVLKLGFSYLASNPLTSVAQPVLKDLTNTVRESSSIGVLDGDEIVYVARSTANRVMSISQGIGSRLPAYCTSMGRVLLAALPDRDLAAYLKRVEVKPLTGKTITDKKTLAEIIRRVRSEGFALCDEELELGLRSLAVPIVAGEGRTLAAMNIGVHAARVTAAEMTRRLLPVLREHARSLAESLA